MPWLRSYLQLNSGLEVTYMSDTVDIDGLIKRLQELDNQVRQGNISNQESLKVLRDTIDETQRTVIQLDKIIAVREAETNSYVSQITQLKEDVDQLQQYNNKAVSNRADLVEKIVLAIIGSAIGALFSYLGTK